MPEGQFIDLKVGNDHVLFTARGPVGGIEETVHQQAVNAYAVSRREINGPSGLRWALETPAPGSVISGVETIRGWAFGTAEPVRSVTFRIDGELIGELPLGGPRQDVARAFPQFPDAGDSGYAAAFNFNELPPGVHQLEALLTTESGVEERRSATFVTAPATAGFLPDPGAVDLADASAEVSRGAVLLRNVRIGGRVTTLELAWNPASQSFEIVAVVQSSSQE